MASLWHHNYFEDGMFSTGCGSLFSDKTYTTVVLMPFRMSAFLCVFTTFIYFSTNSSLAGRSISFDPLYTSISLAKKKKTNYMYWDYATK